METIPRPELEINAMRPESIELIGDRYLVQEIEVSQLKVIGDFDILLVGEDEETRGWRPGIVAQVGNGHKLDTDVTVPMFCQVGDLIIFERLSGREIGLSGEKFRIVTQSSVLGKYTGKL